MLNVTSAAGRIRVTVCKGSPGVVVLAGPQGQIGRVDFPEVGIGVKSVASGWRATKAIWIPFFGGHGQQVDIDYEVAKASDHLRVGEHRTAPEGYPENRSEYAIPETYTFPLNNEGRVRSAISYFHKHRFRDQAQKKRAAGRIMRAAKRHGIEVDKESDVAQAARS